LEDVRDRDIVLGAVSLFFSAGESKAGYVTNDLKEID
jgi:hypothetical protein